MHTICFSIPQSTRNSTVYAEIGPKAIPKVAKEANALAVVMPNTSVQYAVVKKKRSTAQQWEQNATGKVVCT